MEGPTTIHEFISNSFELIWQNIYDQYQNLNNLIKNNVPDFPIQFDPSNQPTDQNNVALGQTFINRAIHQPFQQIYEIPFGSLQTNVEEEISPDPSNSFRVPIPATFQSSLIEDLTYDIIANSQEIDQDGAATPILSSRIDRGDSDSETSLDRAEKIIVTCVDDDIANARIYSHPEISGKIIVPKPAPPGVRRSRRIRVSGRDNILGERIVYDKTGSKISGIFKTTSLCKVRRDKQSNRRQILSDFTVCREPHLKQKCIGVANATVYDHGNYFAETRFQNTHMDELEQMQCGEFVIKPKLTKPFMYVHSSTMILTIFSGFVGVSLNNSPYRKLKSGDYFIVPANTWYSITNLKRYRARIFFIVIGKEIANL